MKKLLFVAFLALGSINADAENFRTTCGVTGNTPDREFFSSDKEYIAYLKLLNDTFCGEYVLPETW